MRTTALFLLPVAGLLFAVACSSSNTDDKNTPTPTPTNDAGPIDSGPTGVPATGPFATPAVPCADSDSAVYADPGTLSSDAASRGKILKCSPSTNLTQAQVQSELTRTGYKGKPVTSGANVYKVLYQTTRGDAAGSVGYSSAIVYMPTVPRADKLPILVGARGSRGDAPRCAVSKQDPSLQGLNDDMYRLAYSLVGLGYGVIVPDLAGYANYGAPGNPPSVYAGAEDVARSTLDGSRALKALYPQLDDKTVIVGHSQGGHNALSSLAKAESYGVQGSLVAVATYSPLWFTQRSWGAVLNQGAALALNVQTTGSGETPSAVGVYYLYTHAEALDGRGEGVKLFKPEFQTAIKNFIDTGCYGENKVLQDNADYAYKLYDNNFADSAGNAGVMTNCPAGDPVCTKWQKRYQDDRPHLLGAAATTPLLVLYGGADTTIPPDRASCGVDRLKSDNANLTFCYETAADHHTILDLRSEYVADWIASKTLGGTEPAACALNETAITATCNQTPTNKE